MKKISFLIVIFICMADVTLAVPQEGGLFYLPEDHQSKPQFGIRTVMRSANNTEIKLLMILIFISVIKIVQKLFEKSLFLYHTVFVLRCRIFRQIKQV